MLARVEVSKQVKINGKYNQNHAHLYVGIYIFGSQYFYLYVDNIFLCHRYENCLIVAIGKGEPSAVMTEYGFK